MPETDLQSAAFPTLDDAQMTLLSRCAALAPRRYRDGETLVAVGDRDFAFFVVRSGAIAIVDHSGDAPRTVTVHHRGQFTGDVSHLTGAPAMLAAVAQGDCEVYE